MFIYSGSELVNDSKRLNADLCDVFHLDPAKVSAIQTLLLSDDSVGELAETFRVLGDVTRVRILDALSRSELCVCDIARLLGLSESAVSHQLRVLRGMRLVRPRRDGRMMFYTLDDQHIVRLFEQGLEHVQERAKRTRGPQLEPTAVTPDHGARRLPSTR